ncbi:MAG TPA: NADH-quinone oxidoreductase subunit NuoH [Tepidisphaeraceae bacterium]|nr:NADH-quinone oxidoreductase subunit NuoH [Tepidisphaeraceae bacterium]
MIELFHRIPAWLLIAVIAHFTILGTVAYLIFLERKVAAWAQDRIGPNRVGPWGLLQSLADGAKMLLKEDYRPANTDPWLFTLAPGIMIFVMIVSIAVLPWGGVKQSTRTFEVKGAVENPVAVAQEHIPYGATILGTPQVRTAGEDDAARTTITATYRYPFQIADLNIGVLFILAILSIAVYGVVIGGWASNNKYSFLGGLRATANMISYEVPLGLSILTIVLMYGTLSLNEIVDRQAHYWLGIIPAWNVFTQPLAFFMLLVCIHAEANRAPFDTAEAEQELVGGYHTEYSAMRFGMFFLAEYAGMITTSAVLVALFFGGWHLPGLGGGVDPNNPSVTTSLVVCVLRAMVMFGKTLLVIFVFMWVRWSLPRFRFDQIMNLAWRALIPISLLILLATAFTIYAFGPHDQHFRETGLISTKMAIILFLVNVLTLAVIMGGSLLLPAAPDTNRRIRVAGSRYLHTPMAPRITGGPAGGAAAAATGANA